MGTLVCPIVNQNKVTDKNKVKVVMGDYKNKIFKAIYFQDYLYHLVANIMST